MHRDKIIFYFEQMLSLIHIKLHYLLLFETLSSEYKLLIAVWQGRSAAPPRHYAIYQFYQKLNSRSFFNRLRLYDWFVGRIFLAIQMTAHCQTVSAQRNDNSWIFTSFVALPTYTQNESLGWIAIQLTLIKIEKETDLLYNNVFPRFFWTFPPPVNAQNGIGERNTYRQRYKSQKH